MMNPESSPDCEIKFANLNFTPSNECVELSFVTAEEVLALPTFSNVPVFAKLFRKSLKLYT